MAFPVPEAETGAVTRPEVIYILTEPPAAAETSVCECEWQRGGLR